MIYGRTARLTIRIGLAACLALATGCGGDGSTPAPGQTATPAPSTPISGEARMLSGTGEVELMHPVRSIEAVYSYGAAGERIEYSAGVDFVVEGDAIRRTAQSRIPDYATYSYQSNPDGSFTFASQPRNPPRTIQLATYIDYRAAFAPPVVSAKPLPNAATNIVCLGDSITKAADTVAFFFRGLPDDGWCALLAQHLAGRATVTLPDTVTGFLQNAAPALTDSLGADVDTVILAFGMNDHLLGEAGAEDFRELLNTTVQGLRAREKNVILVGFFQQNELWDLEKPAETTRYNAIIRDVASAQAVPFVDPLTAFKEAAPAGAPVYQHLTGDFIHHPNNYGQKIYFSLIVPYFLQGDTPADAITGYIPGPWTSR